MKDGEFEGKNLAQALETAAKKLDVPQDELHYEIVDTGRRGVFGLGVRNVHIRIKPPLEQVDELDREDEPKAAAPGRRRRSAAKPAAEKPAVVSSVPAETVAQIEATVGRIIELMNLQLEMQTSPRDGGLAIEFEGDDLKRLTERNGELLAAFQLLLSRMSRRAWPEAGRIQLQCDGAVVSRRDDKIVRLARSAAEQVSRTGQTQKLQPLNAYERRLVHLTIREFNGLTSNSDGQGALKRIRVAKVRSDSLKQ